MNRDDLEQLDEIVLSPASAVVAMAEVNTGATDANTIGLRHDVDDNADSLTTAVLLAAWEHKRGYRSTYFILHTASYWAGSDLRDALETIAGYGHEIGIHANAIPAALESGGDPADILARAIIRLRDWGHDIVGVAPHGDKLCYEDGVVTFVNDEIFSECARPALGDPDREIIRGDQKLRLKPRPLSTFGLEYETYRLPRGRYLSDSGGKWSATFAEALAGEGQLHILQHPDWWSDAFAKGAYIH